VFSFFLFGNFAKAAISEEDLIHYYPFDGDNFASSTLDYLGIVNLSSTNGDPVLDYPVGRFNESLAISSGKIYKDEIYQLYHDNEEFSISYWYKRDVPLSGLAMPIQMTHLLGPTLFQYYFSDDGKYHFDFYNSINQWVNWTSNDSVFIEEEFFNIIVVGQYGTNMTTKFKLYINGEEKSGSWSGGEANANPKEGDDSDADWILNVSETTYNYDLNGYIDDLGFFNRIITTDEISDLQEDAIIPLTTSPTGVIYWAGVGTQYGQIGGEWNVPFYWNACEDYADINELYAYTNMDGEANPSNYYLIYDKSTFIGPQLCSGIAYLTGSVIATTNQSGTTTIWLGTDTETELKESSEFNYIINLGGQSGNYIDNSIISPLTIDPANATTTLSFTYDFTDLAWESGEVCVYNMASNSTTDYCTEITTATGIETMDFPPVESSHYQLNAKYVLYSSGGTALLSSNPFTINFNNPFPESTFSEFFGTSTAAMVCTAEEWASGDWWTALRCNTGKTILDIAETISNATKRAVVSIISMLSNVFPFNIPVKILENWNASENQNLPSELSWLELQDESGNIYLTMPSQWSESTTTIAIWGPTLWTQSTPLNNLFTGIKTLSKYLMWAGFIFLIIKFAKKIMEDLNKDEDINLV